MQEVIIAKQIDTIVVGNRKVQLMRMILQRELQGKAEFSNNPQYIYALNKMIGHQVANASNTTTSNNRIPKYTKVFLTKELWLHLHFFLHDNHIFDPFVFESARGGISTCILACSDAAELTELRKYLHNPARSEAMRAKHSRMESLCESKVFSKMHQPTVEGFTAVLGLQITPEGRIIEESSNLRLTPNQVSRWIVDRHFQSNCKMKVKDYLEDQIQYYTQNNNKSKCALI